MIFFLAFFPAMLLVTVSGDTCTQYTTAAGTCDDESLYTGWVTTIDADADCGLDGCNDATCCEEKATCYTIADLTNFCDGETLKSNPTTLYCDGSSCDPDFDLDTCCNTGSQSGGEGDDQLNEGGSPTNAEEDPSPPPSSST